MVNSRPLFDWIRLSERTFDRKMENGILETGHCRVAVQVAIKRLKVWRNLANALKLLNSTIFFIFIINKAEKLSHFKVTRY